MSRPSDLRPVEELAKDRPHGHKMRYMAGCRCALCRRGNTDYARKLEIAKRTFGPNINVPAEPVREHLMMLREFGIGYKTVGKRAGVGKTGLHKIIKRTKLSMRRRNALRVLAIEPTLENAGKTLRIPAEPTVAKLRQLLRWGYPGVLIARDALRNRFALQVLAFKGKASTVAVKTALGVREFHRAAVKARDRWQEEHGPIPRGHFVYWSGENLKLRPIPRNHDYHHKYPAELREAMRAKNLLVKSYREQRRLAA